MRNFFSLANIFRSFMWKKNFGGLGCFFFKRSRESVLSPWKQVGLGGGSAAKQDHSACFGGLRTHLWLRLPWHREALGAQERPTRL